MPHKISLLRRAAEMVRSGNTAPLIEANDIATQAGDWLWGTLQGDFNQNPSTSQIVVGTLISMIPIIDQVMDLRDIIANVMLLTDDDEANDTDAWLAFTLTGIGLVPIVGSAVKGVGKVILKNTGESLSAALAVLRKLGKGDPVKYLRNINWQDLGKQSATEVKNIVKGLRDSLDEMSTSWHYDLLLPDAAIEGMQATVKRLDDVTPKIDQHMQQAAQEIGHRVNKALDEYQGELPQVGVTNVPKKTKAPELSAPEGNDLKGAPANKVNPPSRKTPSDFTQHKSLNHRKAAAGEYNAHQLMTEKGYTPLGKTDGNFKPGETGIDGIYLHPNPPPDFVITEAKYNKARLGKTRDGKQMNNRWVTKERLEKAGLSRREQDKILRALRKNDGSVQKLLIRNK
ncbi:hypothetical protein [Pseudoalteromonas piscicida]|uniref:hypothetical protein n=1 Tax=Pseudoalteromonas piscicida TaxID=43662 RepID=UPI00309EC865